MSFQVIKHPESISHIPYVPVSDEELAFLEASVALDRSWDHLLHITRCNCEQAEIESAVRLCIELEHKKFSLYRCWKENHPNRFEDGTVSMGMGEVNDTTCERCVDCGMKVNPHNTIKIVDQPGTEFPEIP